MRIVVRVYRRCPGRPTGGEPDRSGPGADRERTRPGAPPPAEVQQPSTGGVVGQSVSSVTRRRRATHHPPAPSPTAAAARAARSTSPSAPVYARAPVPFPRAAVRPSPAPVDAAGAGVGDALATGVGGGVPAPSRRRRRRAGYRDADRHLRRGVPAVRVRRGRRGRHVHDVGAVTPVVRVEHGADAERAGPADRQRLVGPTRHVLPLGRAVVVGPGEPHRRRQVVDHADLLRSVRPAVPRRHPVLDLVPRCHARRGRHRLVGLELRLGTRCSVQTTRGDGPVVRLVDVRQGRRRGDGGGALERPDGVVRDGARHGDRGRAVPEQVERDVDVARAGTRAARGPVGRAAGPRHVAQTVRDVHVECARVGSVRTGVGRGDGVAEGVSGSGRRREVLHDAEVDGL